MDFPPSSPSISTSDFNKKLEEILAESRTAAEVRHKANGLTQATIGELSLNQIRTEAKVADQGARMTRMESALERIEGKMDRVEEKTDSIETKADTIETKATDNGAKTQKTFIEQRALIGSALVTLICWIIDLFTRHH